MKPWKAADFNEKLKEAVETFDRDRAEALCKRLVDHLRERDDAYPTDHSNAVLSLLRRKRHFDLMQLVADALIQNGQTDAKVRRQYAQALIDLGNLTAAISVLRHLYQDTSVGGSTPDPRENPEASGLLGRAYKDLYLLAYNSVDSNRIRSRRFLENSIECYRIVYAGDKSKLWHGINCVALIRRAQSDAIDLEAISDPQQFAESMAAEILAEITSKDHRDKANTWDFATAVEACVGLGKHDDALDWLMRYLDGKYTDAFELGSTYRQLTQVWQLNPDQPPGDKILPILRARLMEKQGSEIEIAVEEAGQERLAELERDTGYEKILGTEGFKSLKWLQKCLLRANCIVKIENTNEDPFGTGFVVRGGDLKPELGEELLILTNSHVISDDPKVSMALHPDKAILVFEMWPDGTSPEFKIAKLLRTSRPDDLDFSLLRTTPALENVNPVHLTSFLPLSDGGQRAYIIGHPRGRKLSFSIHDNYLLDYDKRLVHYRSPTEPGSSGSPVFNEDWELIALHHRGLNNMPRLNGKDGTYAANEGIWIQAIREDLAGVDLA